MKVAILEASHWHVPLNLGALAASDADVIAVSDAQNARGPGIARQFSAAFHQDYRTLLAHEQIDFAFVFGRHCDMAGLARELVDRSIPFSIEKPGGMSAGEVETIAQSARNAGLYVSVPFIFRFSKLLKTLEPLGDDGGWQHMSFRFIAGPLSRYADNDCAWMLRRDQAAGGCTINLAVHFVDLVRRLTGQNIASVSAQMVESPGAADVEVYSAMLLRTDGGAVCNIETGYTYPGGTPEQREFSFSLASTSHYARSGPEEVVITRASDAQQETIPMLFETDDYYADYVRNVIAEFAAGQVASVGLSDLERVMRVIDAAYTSARQGGAQVAVQPVR